MNQTIDKVKVDQALEMVCELGCETVNEITIEIERGVVSEAAQMLNQEEYKCFVNELKLVMQAYK